MDGPWTHNIPTQAKTFKSDSGENMFASETQHKVEKKGRKIPAGFHVSMSLL